MKNLYLFILCAVSLSYSQNPSLKVGSNPYTINSSAAFEIESSAKGFLPPRLTYAQRQAISNPATGLMIYCTDCGTGGEFEFYNGTAWLNLIGGTPAPNIPTITSTITGKVWLAQNLGASKVATSLTDAAAYGDLYQWGRGTDGHQLRTSTTTSTTASSATAAGANFVVSSFDWLTTSRSDLWQGVSGVNNPCPTGYRIPTAAEFIAETNITNGTQAFNFLKIPYAGTRSSNGGITGVGTSSSLWTSTIYSSTHVLAHYLEATYSGTDMTVVRAYACSVRCIKN